MKKLLFAVLLLSVLIITNCSSYNCSVCDDTFRIRSLNHIIIRYEMKAASTDDPVKKTKYLYLANQGRTNILILLKWCMEEKEIPIAGEIIIDKIKPPKE